MFSFLLGRCFAVGAVGLLNVQELGDDCHPSRYAELSHRGVEGLHFAISSRPLVVSVLWEVNPPLCPEKFEVWEPKSWVFAYRTLQRFLLNNFVGTGLGVQSGVAGHMWGDSSWMSHHHFSQDLGCLVVLLGRE